MGVISLYDPGNKINNMQAKHFYSLWFITIKSLLVFAKQYVVANLHTTCNMRMFC